MLLTRAPVAGINEQAHLPAAPRLACVKPVASVHPEPGSNSSLLLYIAIYLSKFFQTGRSRDPAVPARVVSPVSLVLTETCFLLLVSYYFLSVAVLSMFSPLPESSPGRRPVSFPFCECKVTAFF